MQHSQSFSNLAPVLRPAVPLVECNAGGAVPLPEQGAVLSGRLRKAAVAGATVLALAACGDSKPTLGSAKHNETVELPKGAVVLFYELENAERCGGGQGGGEAVLGGVVMAATTQPTRTRRPATSPSATKKKVTVPATCEGAEVQLVACQNNGAPNPSLSPTTLPEFSPRPGTTYAYYPNSCSIVDVTLGDFKKVFGEYDQLEQGTPLTAKNKVDAIVDQD